MHYEALCIKKIMIVCITEKPSVAADIARILGADHKLNGFYEGKDRKSVV